MIDGEKNRRLTYDAKCYLRTKSSIDAMDDVEQVFDRILCACGNCDAADEAFREVFSLFTKEDERTYRITDFMGSEFVKKHGEGLATLILYWMSLTGNILNILIFYHCSRGRMARMFFVDVAQGLR